MTDQQRQILRAVPGRVHSVETFGTVDGPGVRYVLFLQGCPLRCLYCHNPDSIAPCGGSPTTVGEAVDDILRYRSFIARGGVTFSGGEPLLQPDFVVAAGRLLRDAGLHTAIDTAGVRLAGAAKTAVEEADLLLLDIKAYDPAVCKQLTGRDNSLAFEMLDACEAMGKPVWIRHVLVYGYTLDEGQLEALAQKLAGYRCIRRIELLPFHKLGEHKWVDTGMEYTLAGTEATTREETDWAKSIFARHGLRVQ